LTTLDQGSCQRGVFPLVAAPVRLRPDGPPVATGRAAVRGRGWSAQPL